MDDQGSVVEQDPVGRLPALDAERPQAGGFEGRRQSRLFEMCTGL